MHGISARSTRNGGVARVDGPSVVNSGQGHDHGRFGDDAHRRRHARPWEIDITAEFGTHLD